MYRVFAFCSPVDDDVEVIAVLGQLLWVVAKAQINLVDGAYSVENAETTRVDRGDIAESQGSEIVAVLESVLVDGADLGQMNCPEIQTDKEGKFAQRFSLGRRKCAESTAGLKGAGGDGGGTENRQIHAAAGFGCPVQGSAYGVKGVLARIAGQDNGDFIKFIQSADQSLHKIRALH